MSNQQKAWQGNNNNNKKQQPSSSSSNSKKAAGLDFNNTVGKVANTAEEATSQLKQYITKSINDNNPLGLPPNEIESVAKLLMTTPNKSEILEWQNTLMQPASFASEIIRQRDFAQSRFTSSSAAAGDGDSSSSSSAPPSSAASDVSSIASSTSTSKKKGGKGSRGKTVSLGNNNSSSLSSASATGDALIQGTFRECGCFAAAHAFRSNCANCGRIFCMQESDDVCYSCGLSPKTCLALELKVTLGKISEAADKKNKEDLEEAVDRRDQLLQYARERSKRTVVVDDQSGTFLARIANAAASVNDPWATGAERKEAQTEAEKERQRVAEMHRKTGAVSIHLDIVNECVQLGATPLLSEQEREDKDKESKKQDDETTKMMIRGFEGGSSSSSEHQQQDQEKSTAELPSKKVSSYASAAMTGVEQQQQQKEKERQEQAAKKSKQQGNQQEEQNSSLFGQEEQPEGVENNGEGDEEEEEEEEEDVDELGNAISYHGLGRNRVCPLPSLVQSIFYCENEQEAEKKTKVKVEKTNRTLALGTNSKKQQNQQQESSSTTQKKRAVDFRRPEDIKPDVLGNNSNNNNNNKKGSSSSSSSSAASARVQVEYYEEDNSNFLMAEQTEKAFGQDSMSSTLKQRAEKNQNDKVSEHQRLLTFDKEKFLAENNMSSSSSSVLKKQQRKEEQQQQQVDQLMSATKNPKKQKQEEEEEEQEQEGEGEDEGESKTSSKASGTKAPSSVSVSPVVVIDAALLKKAKQLYWQDSEHMCLSMHQPWASLLVHGIKTHEGRGWPTEFRGRLWIHAAAKTASQSDIEQVTAHCREFVPENTKFPSTYPTKCLIGCVSLVDCLDREEYDKKFPIEQRQLGSDSTYCFLCMCAKALPFPLAMEGQHKLYKLEKKVWASAKALLQEKQ